MEKGNSLLRYYMHRNYVWISMCHSWKGETKWGERYHLCLLQSPFLSVLWKPGLDGSLVQPWIVIHLPLGGESETLQTLPFKVTMGWKGQYEHKGLSPGISQTFPGNDHLFRGLERMCQTWIFLVSISLAMVLRRYPLQQQGKRKTRAVAPRLTPLGSYMIQHVICVS